MRVLLLLLLALPAYADDAIRLPRLPAPALPMPAPDTRLTLTGETLYIIDSDVELIVLSSPKGIVNSTTEPGPIRIKGKFADDPTKFQSRTFSGKFVVTIEPIKSGLVELLIVPSGAKTEAEVIRRSLDTKVGKDDDTKPDIKPVEVKSFRVIFVYESGDTSKPSISTVMNARIVEEYLNANCTPENGLAGYWRTDKDADGSNLAPTMRALWASVKPKIDSVPVIAIEVNSKVQILPWPKDAADCLATLKKYKEGK